MANAGVAAGTGAAYGALINATPAGLAAGSGSAYSAVVNTVTHANVASGTGTANAPASTDGTYAGQVAGLFDPAIFDPALFDMPQIIVDAFPTILTAHTTSFASLDNGGGVEAGGGAIAAADATDFRLYISGYEFTRKADWEATIEESLGSPDSVTLKLQDRFGGSPLPFSDVNGGGGFNLERADVLIELVGQALPVFHGRVSSLDGDLPVGMPYPRYELPCADYTEEIYTQRLVGYPDGYNWLINPDGSRSPIDPYSYPSTGDDIQVKSALQLYSNPRFAIDTTGFVGHHHSNYYGDLFTSTDIRGILEIYAGLTDTDENIQYWFDTAYRFHWVVLPRWYETPTDPLLEPAPRDLNNDTPDGTTSIGFRNLKWKFDYSQGIGSNGQYYINGGLGFDYNEGDVAPLFYGSGWDLDGIPAAYPGRADATRNQMAISQDGSITSEDRAAVGRRQRKLTNLGILRGSLTLGNERHHVDGWHKGQYFTLTDSRLPADVNGGTYVIQRVSMHLVPTVNWRIYDIEFGDAPIGRQSTRRQQKANQVDTVVVAPGRLWDIQNRVMNPLPGSTVTIVGQLVYDDGTPKQLPNVRVCLVLDVWDAKTDPTKAQPNVTGVGSLSAPSALTDDFGRFSVDLTVGDNPGYSYEVRAVNC